jgi:hypothetical protein
MSEVSSDIQIVELVRDARKRAIKVAVALAVCAAACVLPAWLSLTDWAWAFTGFFSGAAVFAAALAHGLHTILRDEGVA